MIILWRSASCCWTISCLQAAASALEAKVALLDANHIEHIDARLQVGAQFDYSKKHSRNVREYEQFRLTEGVL